MSEWHILNRGRRKLYAVHRWHIQLIRWIEDCRVLRYMSCRLLLPGRLDKRYELYMSAWHLLNRGRRKLYAVLRWQIRLNSGTDDRYVHWYMSCR